MITVTTRNCIVCGRTGSVEVDREGYEKWKAGAFVQDAFPTMDGAQREMLITGTHPRCWDEMFSGDEDEE